MSSCFSNFCFLYLNIQKKKKKFGFFSLFLFYFAILIFGKNSITEDAITVCRREEITWKKVKYKKSRVYAAIYNILFVYQFRSTSVLELWCEFDFVLEFCHWFLNFGLIFSLSVQLLTLFFRLLCFLARFTLIQGSTCVAKCKN